MSNPTPTAPDLTEADRESLRVQLASWFGDDRQAFLVSHLAPAVERIKAEACATAVAEFQRTALEMARKAAIAERRAEEAEYHVEQLRDARDRAERRIERAERRAEDAEAGNRGLIAACEAAGAKIQELEAAIGRARKVLKGWGDSDTVLCSCGEPVGHADHCDSCCGCGVAGQHEHMATVEHLRRCPICDMRFTLEDACRHEWLDRPESDTRECLICGTEVAG